MSSKLRKALHALAYEGKSVTDAAREAEMNLSALSRAIHRPAIAQHLEEMKAQLCLDAEQLKGRAKAMAILVGIDLLHNAKSEPVKAKMVEFFAGEPKSGPSVNVQINNGGAYEYARPGARVVEINPPTDKQSDGEQS